MGWCGLPDEVTVVEVGPRDGLQIEARLLDTATKVELVNELSLCGFRKIEVGSFMNPKKVPQMADTDQLFRLINRQPATTYTGLVGNLKGAQRAVEAHVDEVNVVVAASETFNRANVGQSVPQSMEGFQEIVRTCGEHGIPAWFSVATAFGCPFEGDVPAESVLGLVHTALEMGACGISLADTTGMAHPRQVAELVTDFRDRFGETELVLHFHNTRGMGFANVLAAMEAGARSFDASLGGLGGCPFAPGATGNVCTEDLVHMLEAMGIRTGVDLDRLISLARGVEPLVGHPLPGQVMRAGKSSDLHEPPPSARP